MENLESIKKQVSNCRGLERRKYNGGFCCPIIPFPCGLGVCNYQNPKIINVPQKENNFGCRYQIPQFVCNFAEQT